MAIFAEMGCKALRVCINILGKNFFANGGRNQEPNEAQDLKVL